MKKPYIFCFQLIEKEGYLFKKSHGSKELKKKYYRISEGKFFVLKKEKISSTIKMEEISSLSLIHLKENLEMEYPYMLEIICPAKPKPIILITDSQKSHHEWCSAIKNNIEIMLSKSEEFSPKIKKEENRYNIIENFKFPRESKEKMIEKIFKNNCCADCSNNEACWVSINLCVLLCLECSGIHRKLGPNISKVRSLKLDNLGNEIIEIFYQCGSSSINQIWEANIMNFMHLKPHFDSKVNIKEKWINLKYVDKELLKKKTSILIICYFKKIKY